MPIMAARPLFSSIARLDSLVSAAEESQPKSMAPLRKSSGKSPGAAPWGVLHHTELEGANEENNLGKARSGDGIRAIDGGPAVGEGVERVSRVVDVAREVDTGAGDDVSQEGELGNASVLDLDVTEAVESLLVGAIKQAEGVEEAERGLGSELGLEGVEGRGGLGRGGGGKGSGRSHKGGEGELHHGEIE